MKKLGFGHLWENLKRKVSILTIVSMVLTGLTPATSAFAESHFTNDVYQFVDELEIEDTLVNEGMFYIPHSHLEVKENTDNKKFVFKVMRKGEIEKYEKVKLTMMDITGKYGKDYTIKVIDKAVFSENVKNISKSKSILEYAAKNEGEEYNYSDAIIDGTLNSENIMTDEEKENFTMSEEEKERMLNVANEALTDIGIDAKVERVGDTTSLDSAEDNESTANDFEEEADENATNATAIESNNAEEKNAEENEGENTNKEENNSEDNSENTTTTNEEASDETVKGFTNTDTTVTEEANNNNSDNVGTTNSEPEDSVGAKLREPEGVGANDDNVGTTNGEPEETTNEETTSEEQTSEETTSEEQTEPVDGTTNESDETEAYETEGEDSTESTTVAETTVKDTTAETTTAETTTVKSTTEESTTEESTTEESTTVESTTEESTNETTTTSENTTTENSTNAKDTKSSKVEKEETNKEEIIKSESGNLNESANDLYGESVATDSDVDTDVASMSEIVYGDEEVKFDVNIATLSSSKAYELVTGLKDDRKKVVPDRSGTPLDIINPNSLENKAFMNEGVEAVEEELKSAYVELNFKPNQVEKLIEITIIDDNKYRGKKQVGFHLSSEDNKNIAGAYSTFTLIIEDDEPVEKSYINFTKTSYEPKDGYVHVEMERTGDVGSIATVMLDSEDITAIHGRDYSEVHTKVVFGMGLTKRHINIPVVSTHINKSASFKLKLQLAEGAEVGEKGTTVCTIKDTDTNFKFANPKLTDKNESENLFGGAKTGDDKLFGDTGYRKVKMTDTMLGDKINLTNIRAYYYLDGELNDDSYFKFSDDGYGFDLFMKSNANLPWERWTHSAGLRMFWPMYYYLYCGYKGVQLNWTKGPNTDNGDIWVQSFYSSKSTTLKSFEGGKWSNRDDNIYFDNENSEGLDIDFKRYGGGYYKDPHLIVNSITPIKRMFKIGRFSAIAPGFINSDGMINPNDHHEQDETYFVDGEDDGYTAIGYIGQTISVSLKNNTRNNPYYIKKLYATDYERNKLIEIAHNDEPDKKDPNKNQLSFEITEELLTKIRDCTREIDGVDGSKDGEFFIVPELAKKPVKLRIQKDDKIEELNIWGKAPTKTTDKEWIYEFGVEDYIRLFVELKDQYKKNYICEGFEKQYIYPKTDFNQSIDVDYEHDYYSYTLDATELLLKPKVVPNGNAIIVRVNKNQDNLFDKTYGFMKTVKPVSNGNYYDYYVMPRGSKVYAKYFEFKARAKDAGNVAVWVEDAAQKIKYAQDTFYYLGRRSIDLNVIYLSAEKADANKYLISGITHFEEQPLGYTTLGTHWQPAVNVGILLDDNSFGYSNEKGEYTLVASKGKNGYYKRIKVVGNGNSIYRDIKLNQKSLVTQEYEIKYKSGTKKVKEKVYKVVPEVILISNNNPNSPKINSVYVEKKDLGDIIFRRTNQITIDGRLKILEVDVSPTKPDGTPYTYTYEEEVKQTATKSIIVKRTATESIIRAEFLVVDPKSHEIKKVIEANERFDFMGIVGYRTSYIFNTGNYNEYKADDILYVRLVTDKKVGDGKGYDIKTGGRSEVPIFNETTYQAISTNIPFAAVAETIPEEVKIDLKKASPTEEELKLPIIGVLDFVSGLAGLTFSQNIEGNKVTIKIGKEFKEKTNKYDEKGKLRDESAVKIDIRHLKTGFEEFEDWARDNVQKHNYSKPVTMGLPIWSFKPMVGIEFSYVKSDIGGNAQGRQYEFTGGNGFFGIVFNFKYTFYFIVGGVPLYVGGEVNLDLVSELGISVDKDKKVVMLTEGSLINQEFFDELTSNTYFDFIIRATMETTAFAGIGICGTIGVRGGFTLNIRFIWNPHIKKKYEKVRPVGLGVSGSIKIWIDALFFNIPIPVYEWGENDMYKYGYFEDIENKNLVKSAKTDESNLYGAVDKTEFKPTPRFKRTSEFVANDNSGDDLFGGTYVIDDTKTRTLINDSYDSSDPKIVSYDSDGDDVKDKALLIYLDDDSHRSDLDRSVLKYMIYDVNSNQWSTPQVLQDDGTADFSPNMVDLDSEKIVVSWASRKTPVNNDTPKANLLKDMEIYSVFFDKETSTFRTITQITNDDYYDYYPKASYDVLSGKLELYYLKNENVGAINDTDDLLNEVQTEVNDSQLMYRVYDLDWDDGEFKWLTDYEDYELPSTLTPTERTAFINKYRGQRIKDLSINLGETINNNPNISDYAVNFAAMVDTTDPAIQNMINTIKEEIEANYDPENPSNIPASAQALIDDLTPRLIGHMKNYSVVSYVVDEDGDPVETTDDTDIFIKIASGSDVKTIRVTNNNVADTMPKLIQVADMSILFWIQNESAIKMLSIGDIIQKSVDDDHVNNGLQTNEINIVTKDNIIMSDKISNIEPFADDRGNIYVAWQQNSNEIPTDEEDNTEIDFKQDLYVAGLIASEDPNDPTRSIYSWSNPVRFTNNGKVNNLPAATDINNNLLLVNNQYNMKTSGDTYNITNSNLVSMTYKKKSSLEVMGTSTGIVNNEDGSKTYDLHIDIQNTGLYAAEGFDYEGTVKYDGRTLLNINGTSNRQLIPRERIRVSSMSNAIGSEGLIFTLTEEEQKRLDKVTLDLNVKEHGINDAGIDYSGSLFDVRERYRFITSEDLTVNDNYFGDYLRTEQVGEDFAVRGTLVNSGNIDGKGDAKIYVIDQDDWDNPIAESEKFTLPMANQMQFEIPISGDKIKNMYKGLKHLVVYVANDVGDRLSIAEVATLQVDRPYRFKVNGSATEVRVKVGETLKLNTSYEPTDRYQGATIMYAVTDGNIATSGDNTITGLEEGVTTMKLTTKEFGGSAEINVIVEPAKNSGGGDYSGGGSSGGGGGGPMIPTNQVVSTTRVNTTKANALSFDVNANPMSWIYDPIANRYRLNINVAGNQVSATNGFYIINETKTIDVNGIPTPTLITDTYYFDNLGNMVTGWVNTMDNKWFFFENMKNINEGKMALGWKKIDNVWYYFTADGSMLTNSITPDGEQVGADGAWMAKTIYAVTQ